MICLLGALLLQACSDNPQLKLGAPQPLALPVTHGDGPRLSEGYNGSLTLSWMRKTPDGSHLEFSPLEQREFGSIQQAAFEPRMFVNWADLPGVIQTGNGQWMAHWLRYSADQVYSYDVVVAQSSDDGATWGDTLPMHTDGTHTEHGFVSAFLSDEGPTLLWLDGRQTPDGPMTLRTGTLTETGDRILEDQIDDSVCDCCQTDVTVSSKGPIAIYRDRTKEEIRDIYVSRYREGKWQPGESVFDDNWNIAGCPVNGPSIVAQNDQVTAAWFTAAAGETRVRLAVSQDGGDTFSPPVDIASGFVSGYVGLTALPNQYRAVSWVARRGDEGRSLFVRLIDPEGGLGPVLSVAPIQQLRVFPQLGYQDGELFLIWTDEVDGGREIRGARVPVI